MRLDFSDLPLKETAFSDKPMTFIDQEPKYFLGAVMDLVAIETGGRRAREHWQQKQIDNLLSHAARKSAFWRKRIGANKAANLKPRPKVPGFVLCSTQNLGSLAPTSSPVRST